MTFRETTGGRVCPHNVPVDYRCYTCQPPSETTVPQVSPNMPTPLPPQPAFGFRFVPNACEHCFCQPAGPVLFNSGSIGGIGETAVNEPEHEQCCNCGMRRVKDRRREVVTHFISRDPVG